MLTINDELEAGVGLARTGNKDQARAHFLHVLKVDAYNETAWLWMSYCMPTIEQSLRCVEHLLTINPQHVKALEAREVLQVRLLLEEAAVMTPATAGPSTPQRRYLLGEALIEARVITPQQLETALHEQQRLASKGKPKRLGEILLKLKYVRPEQLEGAIAVQIDMPMEHTDGMGMIGDFLLNNAIITRAQLYQGLAQQKDLRRRGKPALLGDILVRCGYITPKQLADAMRQWQQQYEQWFN